jgi:hypothetical protein
MHLSEGMQKLVIFFIWQLLNFTDTVMLRMMLRAIFNPIRQQRRLQPQFLPPGGVTTVFRSCVCLSAADVCYVLRNKPCLIKRAAEDVCAMTTRGR